MDLRQIEALHASPSRASPSRGPRGELPLQLELRGLLSGDKGVDDFTAEGSFTVTQEQWMDALKAADYGATLLSEIVLPRETADPVLAEAIDGIHQALQKLRTIGGEGDAVGRVRPAMDHANFGVGLPGSIKSIEYGADPVTGAKLTRDDVYETTSPARIASTFSRCQMASRHQ